MDTSSKSKVLQHLEAHRGEFVSGGALAAELGISRNSVWKAVKALSASGHSISSVTGKGYCLDADSSILSAASIRNHLHSSNVQIEYHDQVDSTNNRCKALAENGAAEGLLIVADCQTAGRGRQGRPFFSPAGTGVYFSLLLRPAFDLADVTLITTYAATCLARAVDETCGTHTQIKWVNDLFSDGHKVSGILTEAAFDAESGSVSYVVVGIGVNVFDPEGGFPADVEYVAHSLCGDRRKRGDVRARIIAATVDNFLQDYPHIPQRPHLDEYRSRSLLDGLHVTLQDRSLGQVEATVVGINDDFTLRIKLADGTTKDLVHGDVHIPSAQINARSDK